MNRALPALLSLGLVAAAEASAYPVLAVDGVVSGVADGTFDIVIEVSSDSGEVLVTESVANFVVVGGAIAVDVDLGAAAAALEGGEVLTVAVEVGDLSASARLGSVLRANLAEDVEIADVVVVAERLGDIPAASLVQAGAVGGIPVAFENITGLPVGIADGDDGNIFALRDLVITAGAIEVAPGAITSARLVDATITSAQLRDSTFSGAAISTVSADRVADGTLTGRNFANDSFAIDDVTDSVAINRMPIGCVNAGIITTASSCFRKSCGTNRLQACESTDCVDVGATPSIQTRLCIGSSEGVTPVGGRLLR